MRPVPSRVRLLDGVRIIDLTSTFAGPYGTLILGDLGADVIKVEPPDGDPTRAIGPHRHPGMGAAFLNLNRAKRSVVLDLSTPEGSAALRRLLTSADVIVHNMRPSAAQRHGIDAVTLHHQHPRIVHCSIRGFGAGPRGHLPAYDDIIQAASGMAAQQAWVGERPQYAGNAVADKVAGLAAAMAIAAALYRRQIEGAGSSIEVPMFEMVTSFSLIEHLYGRTFTPPLGEARYPRVSSPMRRPFRTADGLMAVVIYTDRHWKTFLELVGRDDLLADPRLATLGTRTEHSDAIAALVEAELTKRTTDEWLECLGAAGLPASRFATVDDLFEDDHLRSVGFFQAYHHPTEGPLLQVPTPLIVNGERPALGRPAPVLGADTASIIPTADPVVGTGSDARRMPETVLLPNECH